MRLLQVHGIQMAQYEDRVPSSFSQVTSTPLPCNHRAAAFITTFSLLKSLCSVASVHNTKYISRLLTRYAQVYANHFEEVESVSAGNIAAVIGLKDTYSGDTLVAEGSALRKHGGTLIGIETPPAVFSRSVECQSGADQVYRANGGARIIWIL